MIKGACPHCGKVPFTLRVEAIDGTVDGIKRWKLVEYVCPLCNKIISVQLDPIAVETETIARVEDVIKKNK